MLQKGKKIRFCFLFRTKRLKTQNNVCTRRKVLRQLQTNQTFLSCRELQSADDG